MIVSFIRSPPVSMILSLNKSGRFVSVSCLWVAALLISPSLFAGILATNLECGYWPNPLGVDDARPHLSWQLQNLTPGQRGQFQTACRILVASSTNILAGNQGDLWDSGQTNLASTAVAYGGTALASTQQVFWKVQVWDQNHQPGGWSSVQTWTMGLLNPSDWQGSWICSATMSNLPIFIRPFSVQPGLRRALIYICGLGQYELSANGVKVGNSMLAPGWSMYPKTCLYDSLDITFCLVEGTNVLGVMLGNGMYNVPASSRYAKFTGSFGAPKLNAQLYLLYTNGTSQIVVTDTNWLSTAGPVTFSSVYGGEDYDARLLPAGWNQEGFNASGWTAAVITNSPGGVLRGQSHAAPPIQISQVLQPIRTNSISAGEIVYDSGPKRRADSPALTTHGPAGAVVQITPAETTNSDGTVNRNSVGGRFCLLAIHAGRHRQRSLGSAIFLSWLPLSSGAIDARAGFFPTARGGSFPRCGCSKRRSAGGILFLLRSAF
jgi:alpha-L-rhamnosidase